MYLFGSGSCKGFGFRGFKSLSGLDLAVRGNEKRFYAAWGLSCTSRLKDLKELAGIVNLDPKP